MLSTKAETPKSSNLIILQTDDFFLLEKKNRLFFWRDIKGVRPNLIRVQESLRYFPFPANGNRIDSRISYCVKRPRYGHVQGFYINILFFCCQFDAQTRAAPTLCIPMEGNFHRGCTNLGRLHHHLCASVTCVRRNLIFFFFLGWGFQVKPTTLI